MITVSYRKILSAFAFFAALSLLTAGPLSSAQAEDWDMAKVTCEDITSEEDAIFMVFWLDGYLSAESGDTSMSEAWIEQLVNELDTKCEQYPSARLLDIARNL